ncbi:NMD3-related protein [Thermogladius sp. 4427co]|uniref:NMD3-related protein n=1 Tax=Thermogladius sp. 4427co TaxID=3450718 RepID=UPI003F7AEEF0
MKYCLKCGREVSEEDYVNGLCIDCFRKYGNPFAKQVEIRVKQCVKCGSILYKGEWVQDTLEGIIRKHILEHQHKYLISGVELVGLDPVGGIHEFSKGGFQQEWVFNMLINGKHFVQFTDSIKVFIEKTVCPRCMARASKKITAIIQVRGGKAASLRSRVEEIIRNDPGLAEAVLEIEDAPNGFDIRLIDQLPARKLAYTISRMFGGTVKETFKNVKYDARKGGWLGILTLSVRIPDVSEGSIVRYGNELWIVVKLDEKGMHLENLKSARRAFIPYDEYWGGKVVLVENYYIKGVYEVVAIDKSMVYLLNRDTGEMVETLISNIPFRIEKGDEIKIFVVDNNEYIVKNYTGGNTA